MGTQKANLFVSTNSRSGLKDFYHGTTSLDKFVIISKNSTHGVCLNLYSGFKKIKSKMQVAEKLKLPLFIDNGSFERFRNWRLRDSKKIKQKDKISTEEYQSREVAFEYFSRMFEDAKILLKNSINPKNMILTIPEVIAESEMTKDLQNEFIPLFRELQKKYHFTPIIALQFSPYSDDFHKEMKETAKFIAKNVPQSWNWRVGIPFGNDFKIIQMGRGGGHHYGKVVDLFSNTLKDRKAHLFACGTVTKIKNHGGYTFVKSCDASTLGMMSYTGHYLTETNAIIVDPRALRHWIEPKGDKLGKFHCSLKNAESKRKILANEGWDWKEWLSINKVSNDYKNDQLLKNGKTSEYFRFKILVINFVKGIANFFKAKAKSAKSIGVMR